MQIHVNGNTLEMAEGSTVLDLLAELGMGAGRLAVELNASIVPRSQHGSTPLKDGDTVEIVHAIGGG